MAKVYQDESGQLLFRRSFCAYIDILGFSEKINSNDLVFFNSYLKVLHEELDYIERLHDLSGRDGFKSFELKIFTDNFVFGHPWFDESGESELGNIFEVLSHIQFTFAKANIFFRGAVSMSDLFMDENIVLGPAVIESYKLETEKAIYPRIILSEDVVKIVGMHIGYYGGHSSAPQNKEYLVDIDGYHFLNYLFTLFYDMDPPEHIVINELILHKSAVLVNIEKYSDNFKLFDKYAWVARYHNYFCDNFVLPLFPRINVSKIKIDEALYSKNIKRLV